MYFLPFFILPKYKDISWSLTWLYYTLIWHDYTLRWFGILIKSTKPEKHLSTHIEGEDVNREQEKMSSFISIADRGSKMLWWEKANTIPRILHRTLTRLGLTERARWDHREISTTFTRDGWSIYSATEKHHHRWGTKCPLSLPPSLPHFLLDGGIRIQKELEG